MLDTTHVTCTTRLLCRISPSCDTSRTPITINTWMRVRRIQDARYRKDQSGANAKLERRNLHRLSKSVLSRCIQPLRYRAPTDICETSSVKLEEPRVSATSHAFIWLRIPILFDATLHTQVTDITSRARDISKIHRRNGIRSTFDEQHSKNCTACRQGA